MDTSVIYEKRSTSSGVSFNLSLKDSSLFQKQSKSGPLPIPNVCPPPPALFEKLAKTSDEKESLTNMLMSWYMSGYHTGYYEVADFDQEYYLFV
jgi:survival motor neuron protein